jgi:hypothetical protein
MIDNANPSLIQQSLIIEPQMLSTQVTQLGSGGYPVAVIFAQPTLPPSTVLQLVTRPMGFM